MNARDSYLGVKWLGSEADDPAPCAEVKNA